MDEKMAYIVKILSKEEEEEEESEDKLA